MQSNYAIELRGALVVDEMQPQFAATIAANSDGYFPVAALSGQPCLSEAIDIGLHLIVAL